jgi:alkylation response protein AidB-like acyl-CoA dehydrogenase
MDFSFSEEQSMLGELAREILAKEVTPERLKQVGASSDWIDDPLWQQLAESNLLGVAIPEAYGGMGFGLCELVVLLQELGRVVAPVPAHASLVLGALPIAEFGSEEQRGRWLPALAGGELTLTAALVDADSADPARPATHARQDGEAWLLEGRKRFVPAAGRASRILVPAATGKGVGLFLVDPQAEGVELTPQRTSTGEPVFDLQLREVRVEASELLGGDAVDGARMVSWLHERALVGLCALQVGVSERALEITAEYVRERVQFDVPIGSFQAVQHRAADAFADLEAIRWSTWRAAWRLEQGLSAAREVVVAKFWAADGGSRIANSAQHLHGGIGVDVDYPIHRYFLWSKSLELGLGGAAQQLAWLGRDMARTGPQELQ